MLTSTIERDVLCISSRVYLRPQMFALTIVVNAAP